MVTIYMENTYISLQTQMGVGNTVGEKIRNVSFLLRKEKHGEKLSL